MLTIDETHEEKLVRELVREWRQANQEYIALLNSKRIRTRWIMVHLLSSRLHGLEKRLAEHGVGIRELVKL